VAGASETLIAWRDMARSIGLGASPIQPDYFRFRVILAARPGRPRGVLPPEKAAAGLSQRRLSVLAGEQVRDRRNPNQPG
jgi:hypothetical protein